MNTDQNHPIIYSIMNPTGNITALVESSVDISRQPGTAAQIMRRHPEVEQVGFFQYPYLRMAGGEFCGNASMCAAALYLSGRISGKEPGLNRPAAATESDTPAATAPATVYLHVSGTSEPVEIRLHEKGPGCFDAGIHMPPAQKIAGQLFTFHSVCGTLPVVRMQGISHIVIEPASPFFCLQNEPEAAKQAVREWCVSLSAEGLGLMFLGNQPEDLSSDALSAPSWGGREKNTPAPLSIRLRPLVYVHGSQTIFWENSCASGSSAVGMYLAARTGNTVSLALAQPGGTLRVSSDPAAGETWLYGSVQIIKRYPA